MRFFIKNELLEKSVLYDQHWNNKFFRYVSQYYPYTTSPESPEITSQIAQDILKLIRSEWDIDYTWKVYADNGNYYDKLLNRVSITETIKPIFHNTDAIVDYLNSLIPREFTIKSFFTGSGIAEKCLVARLKSAGGKNINLITKDISAEAIAYAIANCLIWNQLLPPEEQYQVYCVKGITIPGDLLEQNNIIIFQISDAKDTALIEHKMSNKYDVLLLDNGLPYKTTDIADIIFQACLPKSGNDGLIISMLGLDEKITVKLITPYHISQIILALFGKDLHKDYKKKSKYTTPNHYDHAYEFEIHENEEIPITRVISKSAAIIYSWIGVLLRRGKFKDALKVIKVIKNATALSKAIDNIITPPWTSHRQLEEILKTQFFHYKIIEAPLLPHVFGWHYDVEHDCYKNKNGALSDKWSIANHCRLIDPVVLRKSQFLVFPKNEYL